jgi:uncharacterized protein (TIGR03437 family)
VVLALVAGCAQTPGPHLTSATPSPAAHGAIVTIAGERMCDGNCSTAAGELTIGNVRAPLLAFSDASAQIAVPVVAPAGKTDIVLTVSGSSSNALGFEVLP